jgi:hypothetical protein
MTTCPTISPFVTDGNLLIFEISSLINFLSLWQQWQRGSFFSPPVAMLLLTMCPFLFDFMVSNEVFELLLIFVEDFQKYFWEKVL